jgi:hypothetical protein
MGVREILNEREGAASSEEYEIISGKGRMKMITFLKRDGSLHCANYAYLHTVTGSSREIRMDFTRHAVVIRGKNLERISQGLADHRVTFLKESNPDQLLPEASVRVDQIVVLHGRRGEDPTPSAGMALPPSSLRERVKEGPKRLSMRWLSTTCSDGRFRLWERGAAF